MDVADLVAAGMPESQAAEFAAQIGGVQANAARLMAAGMPTAVACILHDQISDAQSGVFTGRAGDIRPLVEIGMSRELAEKLAAAINATPYREWK